MFHFRGLLVAIALFAAVNSACGADRRAVELPPLNEAVIEFCRSHVGKQVGDGQCGTAAIEALRSAGAKTNTDFGTTGPDDDYRWGTPVERFQDVLPGDVVQFRDVMLLLRFPNGTRAIRNYPHHTAVVARNRGGGRFDVYEQNVATVGGDAARQGKLRQRDCDLRQIVKGRVWFYRPEAR